MYLRGKGISGGNQEKSAAISGNGQGRIRLPPADVTRVVGLAAILPILVL